MRKSKHLLIRLKRILMVVLTTIGLMNAGAGLTAASLTSAGAGLTAASTIGVAAVLVGCTGGVPVGLPAPDVVCPDAPPEPVLNAEQRTRQEQVNVYLAQVYDEARWRILLTTKTCSGDVWDWLDPATVPGSEDEPPPPPQYTLPDDVVAAQTELEAYPGLQGPPSSVPKLRPSLTPFVMGDVPAISVQDFLAQDVHGRTDGKDRLYAGIYSVVPNLGASSAISVYENQVERRSMSVMEIAIGCGASESPDRQMIGVTVRRDRLDRSTWDHNQPIPTRLMIEFFTAGYENTGDYQGGWADMKKGFVSRTGVVIAPGSNFTPVSTPGGPVYEAQFHIQNFNGTWWLAYNREWIGHFLPSLFEGPMRSQACEVHFYGEVQYRWENWPYTDMGSGQFAAAGWGQAAYFREPFYIDTAGVSQWPDVHKQSETYDPACYTSSGLRSAGPNYERVLYCGGPGGDAPGCD